MKRPDEGFSETVLWRLDMIRTFAALALATSALAAAAAPAQAEEVALHLKLTGKSPAEAYRSIERAARAVCRGDQADAIYVIYGDRDCVKNTIATTLQKINSPALNQYAVEREAILVASR